MIRHRIFFFLFIIISSKSVAQIHRDSTWKGNVFGILNDSSHNYVLQNASVAIYLANDTTLLSYQLTDNFGKFYFKNLPIDIRLLIKVFYVGYKEKNISFSIPISQKITNLKYINLDRSNNQLEDVIVQSVLPVQMNGDTLEFNADAFTLDKNAVAEDLLRKLPGVTVWGDGTITVNGKQVSQVLVDGKPFFGGNINIATQNISKDAIDKIQVYQEQKKQNNPFDSTTDINIKLKKDKNFGNFGKLAVGYGTKNNYESDASLNYFNPRSQIGIVGADNNVNKIADNVNTLMSNATYKGIGANIEYQPDFSLQGRNHTKAFGGTFLHDFISSPDYYHNNRINGNYFLNNFISMKNSDTKEDIKLNGSNFQSQQSNAVSTSANTQQDFNIHYDRHQTDLSYYTDISGSLNDHNNNNSNLNKLYDSANNLVSNSSSISNDYGNSKNVNIELGFTKQKSIAKSSRLPEDFQAIYSLNLGNNHDKEFNENEFFSEVDTFQNKYFNRQYNSKGNFTKQHLMTSLGDFSKFFFGSQGLLSSLSLVIQNNIDVNSYNSTNLVLNKDAVSGLSTIDNYLSTFNNKYLEINEQPGLTVSKNLTKNLANRYEKDLSFAVDLRKQFFYQKNNSDHSFRDIVRNYNEFIPEININYINDEFGDFRNSYALDFSRTVQFPTIDQLAPLVDSSNQYYIQEGNISLMPAYKNEATVHFEHTSYKAKNTFNYNLKASIGRVFRCFADSSNTDSLGRSTHFMVNSEDHYYDYLNVSANLNKAFKFQEHQIQITVSPSINMSQTPNNINGVWNISNTFSSNNSLGIYYTYEDKLAINAKESYSYYLSKQTNFNNYKFKNNFNSFILSSSIHLTRKLVLSSNATYNYSTSTASKPIKFTIWNALAIYRFLQGNNLELKFSALDLLHQNKNVINYGLNNTITYGTSNVLEQYFMLTIAYYPRTFGKKQKK